MQIIQAAPGDTVLLIRMPKEARVSNEIVKERVAHITTQVVPNGGTGASERAPLMRCRGYRRTKYLMGPEPVQMTLWCCRCHCCSHEQRTDRECERLHFVH